MDPSKVRVLQVIVAALVMGVVCFAMVMFLASPPATWQMTQLAWIGVATAVSAAIAGLTVPQAIQKGLESRLQNSSESIEAIDAQLHQAYLQKTIVGAALIESGIFLNLVLGLMERNYVFWVCALALTILLALHFPTEGGMQQWLAARRESITGRRSF